MVSKYDEELVKQIKKNQYETEYKGVNVLVKPIPEGGNDGDVDPRLYKGIRIMPLIVPFISKPKKNASIEEKIAMPRKMFAEYKGENLVTEGVDTEYITVKSSDSYDVKVRIYKRSNKGDNLPVLIYFHGGGFFGGSVDVVEQLCKLLVSKVDCIVLNVDYRLCPEAHYPEPLEDCWAVTRWAFEHRKELGGANSKLAVAGDSAGGNLAAAITLRDRDEKSNMIGFQALIYPAVNISGKYTQYYRGTDPSLYHTTKRSKKCVNAMYKLMHMLVGGGGGNMLEEVYLQGNLNAEHIYASPILDDFHSLPPTLLAFGEHDFLAFEDFAYARHLTQASVKLKTIIYRGLGHGFADQIGVFPQSEDLIGEIAAMINDN